MEDDKILKFDDFVASGALCSKKKTEALLLIKKFCKGNIPIPQIYETKYGSILLVWKAGEDRFQIFIFGVAEVSYRADEDKSLQKERRLYSQDNYGYGLIRKWLKKNYM